MNIKTYRYLVLLTGLLIAFLNGCKKETFKLAPIVSLTSVSAITSNSANSGGEVSSDGGAFVSERGICLGINPYPTVFENKINNGTGLGTFTCSITGLNPGLTYYVRAYATNSVNTSYSNQSLFTTLTLPPVLTTTDLTVITSTSAISGGNITSDGGSAVMVRGVCWSTSQYPTTANSKTLDGTGSGTFTSNIAGLLPGTVYYIKAYATNCIGTSYGNEIYFTPGTVTDIDGNVYHYVVIGTQTWMVENLKTTKYRNGDAIANVTTNANWAALVGGAYCLYNNTAAYMTAYGALYNWQAANNRNLAPEGWHVPTDAEWTILTTYLGGESVAGGKLKETDNLHWLTPNTGATNSNGFTALPGGKRNFNDGFWGVGSDGAWWSSSEFDANYAWYRYLYSDHANIHRNYTNKLAGFSVRCIQD